MAELRYETKVMGKLEIETRVTPCPHGMMYDNRVISIGDYQCTTCDYFIGTIDRRTITCCKSGG